MQFKFVAMYLLYNGPVSLFVIVELKLLNESEVKASLNKTLIIIKIRPETGWSNYEQADNLKIKFEG